MDQAGSVDPEVQASISNLVSALGGPDAATREYKLGDEALACLRDLRKWLQNYDAKYDRLEVACAIANTSLVTADIPEILGLWETRLRKQKDAYLDRIALACLELLVPLTWPQDIVNKEAHALHFSQSLFLKKCQAKYKRALLHHRSHGLLRVMIRLAAKALRVPHKDREPRDEGVLTLVCSFYRNLLLIDTGDDEDRAATVQEYAKQKVLELFVTLGAGMGAALNAQFDSQDTLLLESLYLTLRGVDISKMNGLAPRDEPVADELGQNLKQMLDSETEMNRGAFKPTRHSRFGTMIAVNEGRGNQVSLSGQRGVAGGLESTLESLDHTKKWHKPVLRGALDEREKSSYMPSTASINGDAAALQTLRAFVSDFLDTSYNPLFVKLRKLIERQQAPRINAVPAMVHYCYMVGWFIDAERSRAAAAGKQMDYQLVGGSLSKSSFGIVMTLLRRGIDPGEFRSTDLVHAAMACFRQILITVRDMSYSSQDEELRDIAEGMKSRIFYEESWLTLLASLPRTCHRRSLPYACETVALTHIVLKMLDEYSKQHTYMFVKMKQRRVKARKRQDGDADSAGDESDADEQHHRESIRVTNERKFSFEKFVLKYVNEPTISAYERVLASYREVSEDVVLQVFSFLRRTFAKTKARALFYRMSLMRLLLTLVGHRGLPQDSKSRKVADQFLKYYVQKFVATAEKMPSLHIQINESMTPADAFYYDHGGQDKQRYKPPKYEFALTPRAQRELGPERQIAVLVAALIDIGKDAYVKWIEQTLTSHLNEGHDAGRRQQLLTVDKDKIKAVHNDALLRLLLRTLGIVVDTTTGRLVIPATVDELVLIERVQWMAKYQNEVVAFENGKVAMDFIQVEGEAPRDDDDSDGENHEDPSLAGRAAHAREHVNSADQSLEAGPRASPEASEASPEAGPQASADHSRQASPEASADHSRQASPEASAEARSRSNPSNGPSKAARDSRKRSRQAAFALEPSDDENEELSQSIAAIRRRTAIDDEDD